MMEQAHPQCRRKKKTRTGADQLQGKEAFDKQRKWVLASNGDYDIEQLQEGLHRGAGTIADPLPTQFREAPEPVVMSIVDERFDQHDGWELLR